MTLCMLSSTPVPALPGAQNTVDTDGDAENFHARACSRPPDPTTRTLPDEDDGDAEEARTLTARTDFAEVVKLHGVLRALAMPCETRPVEDAIMDLGR